MLILRFVVSVFLVGMIVLRAGIVYGEDYPIKPIRIVAAGPPGGAADFAARIIAQGLSSALNQNVVVENRSGASGVIGIELVAQATPDGYTLLAFGSTMWLLPLMQTVQYDPIKSFAPITLINRAPNVLVVHPSLPVKSVKELIALAKTKPGTLNFAAGDPGSPPHLAGELFNTMAGVKITGIPYKGAGPAVSALISGQEVQLMFGSAASVVPHIKAGRLNGLAVGTAEPSPLFPGMPTVAASGLPGFEAGSMQGIWAPAKTPAALVRRLNEEAVRVINKAEIKGMFLNSSVEPVGSTPEQFTVTIKSEMTRMGKIIKDLAIRLN